MNSELTNEHLDSVRIQFVREHDQLTYLFIRYQDRRDVWIREDKPGLFLMRNPEGLWIITEDLTEYTALGYPVTYADSKDEVNPPEGLWQSSKNGKSYLYRMIISHSH